MRIAALHPGIAIFAAVGGVTILLFVLQRPSSPIQRPTEAVARHIPAVQSDQSASNSALSGIARVIDGDTIELHGTRIRLFGIDAPESKQTCELHGRLYPCGQHATEALIKLFGARPVTCTEAGRDRNKRIVARCVVNSIDISRWMVEQGWAVAFRKYSSEYVKDEIDARANKQGIWEGQFLMPEDWRRKQQP